MVHAVLFNPKAFEEENLQKILVQTKGTYEGTMLNAIWNCMESFSDGSIYKSFVQKDGFDKSKIIDCGDDIEKFIYINNYGIIQNKENMEYDELVQKVQDGEITMVQFVEAQEDLVEDWQEFLKDNDLKPTEENAGRFLEYREALAMDCQILGTIPGVND